MATVKNRELLGGASGLPLNTDLDAAAANWLAALEHGRGRAPLTREAYERDVRQFLSYLEGVLDHAPCLGDLQGLGIKTVRGFLAHRRRAGIESRSLARSLSSLRNFFTWLETESILKNRAIAQVARPKIAHGVPKPLTAVKAAAVIEGGMAAGLDWVAARDTAVLLLLYGSGLRLAEALGLTRAEAPMPGTDVLIITGKGGKQRMVPILPVTQAAVERYVALCPYTLENDEPVFRGAKGGVADPYSTAQAAPPVKRS